VRDSLPPAEVGIVPELSSKTSPRSVPTASFLPRLLVAVGAVMLFGSLWGTWGFDRTVVPAVGINAWALLQRTDVLLAILAAITLAGALLPRRDRGVGLSVVGAVGSIALVVKLLLESDPARGARYSLLSAAIVVIGSAAELAPAPVKARVAPVGRLLRRARVPLPRSQADARAWLDFARWAATPVWRVVSSTPVLAAIVWIAAAPLIPLSPGGGTDGSWITALHIAHQRGLDFGTDFLYTYGPLGYLTVPRAYDPTQLRVGWAYVALVYYGLAVAVIWAVRQSFPSLVAALAAMLALECFRIVSPDEQAQFAVVAIAFICAAGLLRSPDLRRSRWGIVLLGVAGVAGGAEMLIKLNSGVTIALVLGLVALTDATPRKPAAVLSFGGGLLVGLLGGWVLSGQPLGALDDYIRGSLQIVSGYPDYQYNEESGRAWEYVGALSIIPALGWIAWTRTATWPLRQRAVLLLITAAVIYSTFKQGFVRHDAHSLAFFATALAVTAGLAFRGSQRSTTLLTYALCLVCFVGAAKPALYEFHRPRGTYNAVRESLRVLQKPEALDQLALEQTRAAQAIPPEALRLLGRHTVHFFPTETSVAWTQPQLNWRPLPVIQGFTAYTKYLDDRNAEMLRSDRAPERLLRTKEYSHFEDPEATMEVACRYVQQFAQDNWQVLARTADRCGRPKRVARVATATEELIDVPAIGPNELLYFRVHGWEKPLGERIKGFLWKSDDRSVWFDGATNGGRVAPTLGTARNLLSISPASDYTGDFKLGLGPRQLTFRIMTHGVVSLPRPVRRDLVVEFYSVPLSRPAVENAR
jgi:hypothetical protein